MSYQKRISPAKLKVLYQRQQNPTWDLNYVPGILATPQEAPSISRAFILTPKKFGGREIHLLSTAERDAALLGIYHPDVVGLQEQRILAPEPAVHPLWTYPGIDRSSLRPLNGLIDVADRLDSLDVLPRIKVSHPEIAGEQMTVVYPWCGDLLWAIARADGHIDCINWTIKDKRQDFMRAGPSRYGRPQSSEPTRAILARHEIEATLYLDVNIPTKRIAGEEINLNVAANLRQLFLYHRRQLSISGNQRAEILQKFQDAMSLGITPAEVIVLFVERGRYSVDECRSVFYQAIWHRQLRVDLFQPILINRPMHPEVRDVTVVYADWFGAML